MTTTFAQLGLPEPLVRALSNKDITEPFPVQAATIPDALAGRDVSGKAPTGSGKTLAFGLPLLANVEKAHKSKPKALILAPTRELAEQIKRELASPARAMKRHVFAVYGGVSYGPQKQAFRKGVDVLVATPGRLEDLIEQGIVDLSQANIVVVDEADRMADMGFLPSVKKILRRTSKKRQTLLFSATLDGDIAILTRDFQRDPVRHEAEGVEEQAIDARHHFWLVSNHDRLHHTAQVVEQAGRSIVFTRTRRGADRLAKQLSREGVQAVAMHGGLSQNQRNRALRSFSSYKSQALVATDVAARGIHIDAVESVIHFDPPADHKDYLHRSGRTARAGASGTVVSFVSGNQRRTVGRMQRELDLSAPISEPRLEDLQDGGHRIGEPGSRESRSNHGAARPAEHSAKREHGAKRDRGDKRSNGQNRNGGKPAETGPNSVYVANLPWTHGDEELQQLFEEYGKVHNSTVIIDKRTGRSKGFGFVDMPQRSARRAIDALHGREIEGRDLTVRFAQPRKYGA
ncbi:MAG: DEAD/DEAH box helicase [bacterium]|nr:DEAD/DEAH box helicase [bacterium]